MTSGQETKRVYSYNPEPEKCDKEVREEQAHKVNLVAGLDVLELVNVNVTQRLQRLLIFLRDEFRQTCVTDEHRRPETGHFADEFCTLLSKQYRQNSQLVSLIICCAFRNQTRFINTQDN